MSSKEFDESLAAIYNGLKDVFANEINRMIEKGYSVDSKLKREEELSYIGCQANEFLNEIRENTNFFISQGLFSDFVKCDFLIDERVVDLIKSYGRYGLSESEREKNLDFLEKEFSLKKF